MALAPAARIFDPHALPKLPAVFIAGHKALPRLWRISAIIRPAIDMVPKNIAVGPVIIFVGYVSTPLPIRVIGAALIPEYSAAILIAVLIA
jgi:hypothetical protein